MVRSKTVRKRAVRDTEPNPDAVNFISFAAYKLYINLKSRQIMTEKGYDHAGLAVFNLLSIFQAIRWEGMLSVNYPVYKDLVKVFYANLYLEHGQIMSRCRGVPITLTSQTIATLIDCDNEGEEIYFEDWPSNFDRVRIENDIEYVFGRRMVREALVNTKASDMPLIHHLVHHVLVYNVIPRGGHWNAVKPLEVYLIARIMQGQKVHLPYIISRHMKYTMLSKRETSLVYGRLITSILTHFKIPFMGEKETLHIRPTYDIINKGTLKRMGYTEIDNEWVLKEKSSEKSKRPKMSGEGTSSSAPPASSTPLEDEVQHIKFKLDIALNTLAEMTRKQEAQEAQNRSMQRTLQAVHNMLANRQAHQQPEPIINIDDILHDLDQQTAAPSAAPSTAGPSSSSPQTSPPPTMYF